MPDNKIERRFTTGKIEVRAAGDGAPATLSGLAVPYNSPSHLINEDGREFIEYIIPGAFSSTLSDESAEVMMLYSHEWSMPLARRGAGRLELSEDASGIHFTATPPDTTRTQDLIKDIGAGNVRGMSFGFSATEDRWYKAADGTLAREIVKGILYEISPVVSPAYPDTAIASRSLKEFQKRERKPQTPNALRAAKLRLLKAKSKTTNYSERNRI